MNNQVVEIETILKNLDRLIIAQVGEPLSPLQEMILRGAWENQTFDDIARQSDYTVQYIKEVAAKLWKLLSELLEDDISKRNFRVAMLRRFQNNPNFMKSKQRSDQVHHDWGNAPSISTFFGRYKELNIIENWIVFEHCRLIAIIGTRGVGKTTLSLKLGKDYFGKTKEFEYVVWRSLSNAPPLRDILADILLVVSEQQITDLPDADEQQIFLLLNYLQQSRCLVILDSFESLQKNQVEQNKYHELLKKFGGGEHQSCLILTSRENPLEIELLEGDTQPVRSLHLQGLDQQSVQGLFEAIGHFSGLEKEWQQLIEAYGGNPLALKLVAKHIQKVFESNISEFIRTEKYVFYGLREILDSHFECLSENEKEIIFWLAINYEPVSVSELQKDIISPLVQAKVPESLYFLQRQIPLKKQSIIFIRRPDQDQCNNLEIIQKHEVTAYKLQLVLIEYLLERLVKEIIKEIESNQLNLFNQYALMKATLQEVVREKQCRFILKPILNELVIRFKTPDAVRDRLKDILKNIQQNTPRKPGYTAGNIINLLCQLQTNTNKSNLNEEDFSNLSIRQVYLQGVELKNTNFFQSEITQCIFTNTLSSVLSVAFSPDGHILVIGDSRGNIYLWSMIDGRQLLSFKGHKNWVWSVQFSPDGKRLASASDDTTIKIWDVKTGQYLRILQEHTNWVRTIAFSPDGKLLASGSDDTTIKIWDVQTGRCLKTLKGHQMRVWSVAFCPTNGTILVSGSDDQKIKVWDIQSGDCLKILEDHKMPVQAVRFDHSGKILASGSADRTVKIWDFERGKCLETLDFQDNSVWEIVFSKDAQTLAIATDDKNVRIYDLNTLNLVKNFQGHESRIWSVAFSPDGTTLATGGDDKTVKTWNLKTG